MVRRLSPCLGCWGVLQGHLAPGPRQLPGSWASPQRTGLGGWVGPGVPGLSPPPCHPHRWRTARSQPWSPRTSAWSSTPATPSCLPHAPSATYLAVGACGPRRGEPARSALRPVSLAPPEEASAHLWGCGCCVGGAEESWGLPARCSRKACVSTVGPLWVAPGDLTPQQPRDPVAGPRGRWGRGTLDGSSPGTCPEPGLPAPRGLDPRPNVLFCILGEGEEGSGGTPPQEWAHPGCQVPAGHLQ